MHLLRWARAMSVSDVDLELEKKVDRLSRVMIDRSIVVCPSVLVAQSQRMDD